MEFCRVSAAGRRELSRPVGPQIEVPAGTTGMFGCKELWLWLFFVVREEIPIRSLIKVLINMWCCGAQACQEFCLNAFACFLILFHKNQYFYIAQKVTVATAFILTFTLCSIYI